ncbi:MAG: glycosyltransferase family 9 protein [Blastocatellia bacterium]
MPTDPRNILVIHIAGLGQTVLALPALGSLRQHLPSARITVASSAAAADLLRLAGSVNEVLPVGRLRGGEVFYPSAFYRGAKSLGEIRRGLYDLAIEFQSNTEAGIAMQLANPAARLSRKSTTLGAVIEKVVPGLIKQTSPHVAHEYLKRLEPLGVRPTESEPRIGTDKASDEQIERLLRKHGLQMGELLAGIHAGAGPGRPRWPLERFASIGARLIHNFNARVLVFAGPSERGMAKRLVALLPAKRAIPIQSPKIADFVSAAARLSLFIGNHSGPAHLAAAAGAPVVAVSASLKTTGQATPHDLLGNRVEHLRAPHIELVSEEEVYEAASRLMKINRADFLRSR